jgi:excisionase family DNA binding protein
MNGGMKNETKGDGLLSYKQAASLLNICSRTLRRMVDAGQLQAVRIRGRVLFRPADILKIQEQGTA